VPELSSTSIRAGRDAPREVGGHDEAAVHVEVTDGVLERSTRAVVHPPHRLPCTRLGRNRLLDHLRARLQRFAERSRAAVEIHDADGEILEPVGRFEEGVEVGEAHHEGEEPAEQHQAPREPVPQERTRSRRSLPCRCRPPAHARGR